MMKMLALADRVFAEVRHCGRRLAYAFFRAGNLGTALLALRRLGDSAEQALQELAMGSLQRDIRSRAAAELRVRRPLDGWKGYMVLRTA